MLFKIAWRNLWRNKRRSLIVLTSLVVGVAVLIISDSVMQGMIYQMLHNNISRHVSHIQIHKKGCHDNKIIQNNIPNPEEVEKVLKNSEFVEHYGKRLITFGLIRSAAGSSGGAIVGVEPGKEKKITDIAASIVDGNYIESEKGGIVIGKKMAERLEVGVGDKIVAVAAGLDSTVSYELFRVTGIFSTSSAAFERSHVFVPINALSDMLSMNGRVSEFAMVTTDQRNTLEFKEILKDKLGDYYEVLAYQDIIPLIVAYVSSYKQFIIVFYVIIGIAVIFGVINTMLMSVFERIQEFGVLMSIGMKNNKIFVMILQEALALGIIGTIFGFIVGLGVFYYLNYAGINLAAFSESLSSFGVSNVIYPVLSVDLVINSILIMPIMTVIGSLYPAIKTVRLQPTDAMRYV